MAKRKTEEVDECSTTDDLSLSDEDRTAETTARELITAWLDLHGTKLFALESSKFIAREAKRKNLQQLR